MKVSKRQLRRIIKETLLNEVSEPDILDLARRPEGVSLDDLNAEFGRAAFDLVDELSEDDIVWLDDQEGIVYASGSQPSPGLEPARKRYAN